MRGRRLFDIHAKTGPAGSMMMIVTPSDSKCPPAYSEFGQTIVSRSLLSKSLQDHKRDCKENDCQTEKLYLAVLSILDVLMPGEMGRDHHGETRRRQMKTSEQLYREWRVGDSFMGTGFACGYYAECAKKAVEANEAPAIVALAAYDHATSGMERWHEFHRPKFSKELAVGKRWERIRELMFEVVSDAPNGSATEFMLETAHDYFDRGDHKRMMRALKFAELRSIASVTRKPILELIELLAEEPGDWEGMSTATELARVDRENRTTSHRYCSRKAWYGGYCYQHARMLTGFYAPDRNDEPDGYCSWWIRER